MVGSDNNKTKFDTTYGFGSGWQAAGSPKGKPPQQPQQQAQQAPQFDTTYGYGSGWQAAGSPKGKPPAAGPYSSAQTQQRPGAPQKPAAPGPYSGRSTIKPPQYIDTDTTESAVNNILAQGHQYGDQRYQMKQLDRAGFSRGRGQQFIAGQESAQAMSKAAETAAQARSEDQAANAKMRADYEKARELEAQNLAMVQHAQSQADWSRRFAAQSAAAQLQMAQQQASLQLMLSLMK